MQYVPFILLLLITAIVLVLVFMRVIKYSWYQLCIVHKDQTLYKKQVPRPKITEANSLLNKVQQGIFITNQAHYLQMVSAIKLVCCYLNPNIN